MKIEMKINDICSKVLSMVKSQISYQPLNLKRILEVVKRFGRNFHSGLYGSLPGFAVTPWEFVVFDGSVENFAFVGQ